MKEIILSATGTAFVLLTRDIYIIVSRLVAKYKQDKKYEEYVRMIKESTSKIQQWIDEANPEDYKAEKNFTLQLCDRCDKLKKNIIEEQDRNICLDCKVEE